MYTHSVREREKNLNAILNETSYRNDRVKKIETMRNNKKINILIKNCISRDIFKIIKMWLVSARKTKIKNTKFLSTLSNHNKKLSDCR